MTGAEAGSAPGCWEHLGVSDCVYSTWNKINRWLMSCLGSSGQLRGVETPGGWV